MRYIEIVLENINYRKILLWYTILLLAGFSMIQNVFSQPVISFIQEGKYGFRDLNDRVIVSPAYDFVLDFCKGCELTAVAEGIYHESLNSSEEPVVFFTGKFGLINLQGEQITPVVFDMFLDVGNTYAIMGEGSGHLQFDHWPTLSQAHFEGISGAIDVSGDTIVPFIMSQIRPVDLPDKNYWIVNQSDREGFSLLDQNGQNISYEFYDSICEYSEGLFRIESNGKFGFIDISGRIMIPPIYGNASRFERGTAGVRLGNEFFMIYSTGSKAIHVPFAYDTIYPFSEGLAKMKVFDQFGFIDRSGYFLTDPDFTNARSFYNGIAPVENEVEFGYLHANGTRDMVPYYTHEELNTWELLDTLSKEFNISVDLDELKDTQYFFYPVKDWNFRILCQFALEAIRWAPYQYYQYPHMLPEVQAGEGVLAGRFLFNMDFWDPGNEKWERFKTSIIYPLLSSEENRRTIWEWVKPVFKEVWISMPELHRYEYLKLLEYLDTYFRIYPREDISQHLQTNESLFAHYHYDGSTSPYRKTSALIDRLIIIHRVIDVKEAAKWILRIKETVIQWEKYQQSGNQISSQTKN